MSKITKSVMGTNKWELLEKILLAIFLLLYALIFAIKLPTRIFAGETVLLAQAIIYGVFGVGGALLFHREIIAGIKGWKLSPLKNILWLIGAFFASIFITSIAAIPAASMGYEDLSNATGGLLMMQTIGKTASVLVIGLFGPITEECVYRVFLIGKVNTKIPLWVCVVASSLLFALMHLYGFSLLDFLGVLPLFIQGLIMALYMPQRGISLCHWLCTS